MSALFEKLPLKSPHLKTTYHIPAFIYGTAWKKSATADLVYLALSNGFTAIDTAAQPKHYQEDLVAAGISKAISDGTIKRRNLYLQTKFTSIDGQDPKKMPYDPKSSITDQVNSSVISSLQHFDFGDVVSSGDIPDTYIDTLILHSPMPTINETMEVWQTLEQYVPREIRHLGISNCTMFDLMDLYERSHIKPTLVQNRFFANTKYDIGLRKFCAEKGIIYQSFWTLTANPKLISSAPVRQLSKELSITTAAALYSLVLALGNTTVLNGTTSLQHMKEDWDAIRTVKDYAISNPTNWISLVDGFKKLIGQPP
jgi:diketogulonate reductase-like aldo/keto reductase